ncbi:GerAB/ArcD/ProY family transporter [Dehalobacter sp. UNSWDHB]|uniref:GerAB/ArcD/ProY family transporter n=1 Tax=Dehalobacter sp. UNSWDHB TaxID=1339256 RepID=UPI0032B71796
MGKERISGTQTAMLLFIVMTSTAILFIPGLTATTTKQNAWLVSLGAGILTFGVLIISAKLAQRFPGLTIAEYLPLIVGKIGGKALAVSYILFFTVLNILVVRETSEFLTVSALFGTPGIPINLVFVLICWYSAQKGIEVIARMNQFILPLFVFAYLMACILAIPKADPSSLIPILEDGISAVMQNIWIPVQWYGEIAVLLMLIPLMNKPQEVLKKASYAVISTMLLLTFGSLAVLTVLGADVAGQMIFPIWFTVKTIEYGNYIQRVELLALPLWLTGIMVKSSLLFYVTILAARQSVSRKHPKLIAASVMVIVFSGASFLIPNTMALLEFLTTYWPSISLLFEVVLPLLLLAITLIRKKKGGCMQ